MQSPKDRKAIPDILTANAIQELFEDMYSAPSDEEGAARDSACNDAAGKAETETKKTGL